MSAAMTVADRLADVLASGRRHPLGVAGLLIASEIEAGRTPIQPGYEGAFALSADDWHYPAVVSLDGDEVRLVAILANRPGTGALRRLIDGIRQAGKRPVIVEPIGPTMPRILKRWGWVRSIRGDGEERMEEWRPRAAAEKARTAAESPSVGTTEGRAPSPSKTPTGDGVES